MAEGLQKKIEYANLQFISAFAMEKILDFQTWEIPGEHARGHFRLLLSENDTGIDGMDAPIRLLGQGNHAGVLFSGYPEKVEIKIEGRYKIAEVQAVSGTIELDRKSCNRVFQKKAQTYLGIANTVTADTKHSACILSGNDRQTGRTLIQYQETDWSFLKRMASQLGLPLVPDISYYYPRFYLGLPEGEKRELGEILSCDMCFDGRYYAVSGKCQVDREDFICYDVVTGTSLSLGDRVTYGGRELLVSRKKTELVRGEVIFTYRLAGNSYTCVPWEDNPDYTGMSFVGEIVKTQGEQVEVRFDIDESASGGNCYEFAPATGNLMYCMPQQGTKTALYLGNGDEAQGIATGCIRTNGSTCEGTGSPEKKSFRSEHGKGMTLYPQSMGLDGGETGRIAFEDETGTAIESNGALVLMAKEGIRLESMTEIAMQGVSDIMALYAEGKSGFCVNGSVDILGEKTGLAGTVYCEYAPFDDAPVKGEFDWCGFARNLVMGLAVGAACVAISIFLPGIGAVLSGALFGAGIGAISASITGAVKDYSSGNVRSLEDAKKDTAISMISGAITGAIGVKFPKMDWFKEGLVDVGSGMLTRAMYALSDKDMSSDEKLAYVFDVKQMGVDFVTGVAIHFAFKGVSSVKKKMTANKSGTSSIKGGTDVLDEIKRIDEIEVEFNYNSKYDETEFARQLADQQKGMNELTVQEYLDNRQKYIEQGRAIESNAAQQAAREKAFVDKVDELQDAGLSLKEAEEQAQKWLDTQAALHNPDQVAGGYASNVSGVGDKGVNSSIGSQWRYRINDVDAQIQKMAESMSEAERNSTYLNVNMIYKGD